MGNSHLAFLLLLLLSKVLNFYFSIKQKLQRLLQLQILYQVSEVNAGS